MDRKIILENARQHLAINDFNTIQKAMLDSRAQSIILTAPTGSGKTLAFAARILMDIKNTGSTQAIVIAPSRELVIQIAEVMRGIARGLKTVALYGGHSMDDEIKSLSPAPSIIIATPGRLLDHLQRGTISIHSPQILVLDEYDKSLELGFETEMRRIIRRIGPADKTILTSATKINELPGFINLKQPQHIEYAPESTTPQERTEVIQVPSYTPDKLDTLCNLLHTLSPQSRSIVFVNHRDSARRVYERIRRDHIDAGLYHGELDQQQRAMTLQLFENGTYPILISTDLAARGLDIANVTDVIHYHIPPTPQTWIHRNGRTARIDNTGRVYVITSESDTIPDYITFNRTFDPPVATDTPIKSETASLYFSAGKKEKISRGDILGFIAANSSIPPAAIGKITIADHYALAAMPKSLINDVFDHIKGMKIKGKKVKISPVKA